MEKQVTIRFLQSGTAHGYANFAGDTATIDRDDALRLAQLGVVAIQPATAENALQKPIKETAAAVQPKNKG